MIKIGSKVRAKFGLNQLQIFSLLSQGLSLEKTYIVLDTQNYLGRDYVKFSESKHWQTSEWFDVVEKPSAGFIINFDF
jgi:hypothetical protein